jgi:hypothetical protein
MVSWDLTPFEERNARAISNDHSFRSRQRWEEAALGRGQSQLYPDPFQNGGLIEAMGGLVAWLAAKASEPLLQKTVSALGIAALMA